MQKLIDIYKNYKNKCIILLEARFNGCGIGGMAFLLHRNLRAGDSDNVDATILAHKSEIVFEHDFLWYLHVHREWAWRAFGMTTNV